MEGFVMINVTRGAGKTYECFYLWQIEIISGCWGSIDHKVLSFSVCFQEKYTLVEKTHNEVSPRSA